MSADKSTWEPDTQAAIKALIRATIKEAGDVDPALLPHKVKEALQGQATGALDIEEYIKQVMRERNNGDV